MVMNPMVEKLNKHLKQIRAKANKALLWDYET